MADPEEDSIFKEARDQFLSSLSTNEISIFSNCVSGSQLLRDVENLEAIVSNKNRFGGALQKIKKFSDCLEPYFEVIGIIIQAHPEYASFIWGAARLVLQLSSNFATFFEKLAKTLERLAEVFPRYHELARLFEGSHKSSQRLRSSLCEVYKDLFQFFQSVALVFMKEDGSKKCHSRVLTSLLWKPFDQRFEDLLKQLDFHAKLVKDELQLAQYQENRQGWQHNSEEREREAEERILAAKAREVSEHARIIADEMKQMNETKFKEDTVQVIRRWLHPPNFMEDFERAQDLREDGTSEWLLNEPKFQTWMTSQALLNSGASKGKFDERALWIKGNPGYGKTVLAASVISQLRSSNTVFYYFFRAGNITLDNREAMYRAILAQILWSHKRDEDVIDRFAFAMSDISDGQLVASLRELAELIRICLQSMGECFIILDGIDECEDSTALVKDLLQSTAVLGIKIAMFSRPNVISLSNAIQEKQQLPIGKSTSGDIRHFLSQRLNILLEDQLLPLGVHTDVLINHLATGADGMFLWARLMITYLNSLALTPEERIKTIMNVTFPDGLENMYGRIVKLICSRDRPEQQLAKPGEISTVHATNTECNDLSHLSRAIVMICGGLIEVGNVEGSGYFVGGPCLQFSHLTASEYFSRFEISTKDGVWESVPTGPSLEARSHLEMAQSCLKYLTYHMPAQRLSEPLSLYTIPANLNRDFPLSNYAVMYWIDHLYRGLAESCKILSSSPKLELDTIITALSGFLSHDLVLTSWIEAFYIFHEVPLFETLQKCCDLICLAIPKVRKLDQDIRGIYEDLHDFSQYLRDLHRYWGAQLFISPGIIWEEVKAFTPCRLVGQSCSTKVNSLFIDNPTREGLSTTYLCKISATSSNRSLVGVLSIWPSRLYQEHKQDRKERRMEVLLNNISRVCSGWIARYELWSVKDPPERNMDITIDLETNEIWLQMQHSLWQDVPREETALWNLQFPLAISPSAHQFTILRTVYTLNSKAKVESSVLPLRFNDSVRKHWTLGGLKRGLEAKNASGKSFGNGDVLNRHDELYFYWFTFSTEGHYLFFMDMENQEAPNLAVFGNPAPDALEWSLEGYLATTAYLGTDFPQNYRKVVFHPQRPLVALALCGMAFVWPFQHGKKLLRCSYDPECPEELDFSSCGRYLVTKKLGSTRLTITTLPYGVTELFPELSTDALSLPSRLDSQLEKSGNEYVSTSSTSQNQFESYIKVDPIGKDCTVLVPFGGRGKDSNGKALEMYKPEPSIFAIPSREVSLGNRTMDINIGGKSTGIDVTKSREGLFIDMWQAAEDKGTSQTVEITKLPDWPGMSSTSASVQLPKANGDTMKITLNTSARLWNNLSKPAEQHLPAIVERDPASIIAAHKEKEREKKDAKKWISPVAVFGISSRNATSIPRRLLSRRKKSPLKII